MDTLPVDGTILPDVNTDEVVAGTGIIFLAHCWKCQVLRITVRTLIPFVNMSEESDVDIPLLKLVQQKIGLLTGKGGG